MSLGLIQCLRIDHIPKSAATVPTVCVPAVPASFASVKRGLPSGNQTWQSGQSGQLSMAF